MKRMEEEEDEEEEDNNNNNNNNNNNGGHRSLKTTQPFDLRPDSHAHLI